MTESKHTDRQFKEEIIYPIEDCVRDRLDDYVEEKIVDYVWIKTWPQGIGQVKIQILHQFRENSQ